MNYYSIIKIFGSYDVSYGTYIPTTFSSLKRGLETLINHNMFFEGLHISLYEKNPEDFLNKVWEKFEENQRESFELFKAGITYSKYDRLGTVKKRKAFRGTIALGRNFKEPHFSGNDVYIKFCRRCENIQIHNRLPQADNSCRYCKEHGGYQNKNKNRDKQTFSNIALMVGPQKKEGLKKIPKKPKALTVLKKQRIIEPPDGYQSIKNWGKNIGVSRQAAYIHVQKGRVHSLIIRGHTFVKIGEASPTISLTDFIMKKLPKGEPIFNRLPTRVFNLFTYLGINSDEDVYAFIRTNRDWQGQLLNIYSCGLDSLRCVIHAYGKKSERRTP